MMNKSQAAELIPETRKRSMFLVLSAFTLAIALIYAFGIGLPYSVEIGIFAIFVVLTGIPHGAVDHIVAADVFGLKQTFSDQVRFYGTYLLTMIALGAVWIMSPVTGFIIFIVISVFHFGQGDLNWMTKGVSTALSWMLYISRGVMLITVPVIAHLEITAPIIEAAAGFDLFEQGWLVENALLISLVSIAQHFVLMIFLAGRVSKRYLVQEYILVALLALIFLFAHPLVSFGIYFGIWHSLNHFFELRDHLSGQQSTTGFFSLYKRTVPFTLISFLGLFFLWYLLDVTGSENQMISLLFILISVLTLPHMLLINQMYQKK